MSVRRHRRLRSASAAALILSSATLIGISLPSPALAQPAAPAAGASGAVGEAIANMMSGDREKVLAGRKALLDRLSGNPSATVLNAYAREVAQGIMPVVNGSDPHAKLNAALVLQRLADQSGSTDLAAPIAKLIRDESPAIASFGLRASVNVLPRVLGNPVLAGNDPLLPAIYEALAKHAGNEAVAVDVYSALTKTLSNQAAANDLGAAAVKEATPRVVDALHKVITSRVTDFGTGNVAEPGAEGQLAVGFLTRASTWQAMSDAQKTKTISILLALLDGSAAEMAAIKDPGTTGRGRMDGVRGLLKYTAQGLSVTARNANKGADLIEKCDKIQSVGASTSNAQVAALVSDVVAAFSAAYPEIAAPGSQPAAAPTAAPAAPAR